MKKIPYIKTTLILFSVFFILLFLKNISIPTSSVQVAQSKEEIEVQKRSEDEPLVEDKRVYEGHDGTQVKHVYLTIFDQQTVPENDRTFYQLNESYKEYSNLDDGPKLQVLFQTGTAEGPDKKGFIKTETTANATIELRGRSSRRKAQKSYKVRLNDNGGLWFGQSVLNLNKHAEDTTRVRNKLAFDYYKEIPDLISLRTDFVQLHIKDLTNPGNDGTFEDYGLYTHIEQLNDEALAARGLNPDGHLYKAENFEFFRYQDKLKSSSDPDYDKKVFESVLKISGSENHEELLTMLDDVNDFSKPFDEVFKKYFQEDNYLTWLASNILFGNYDTMSTNYYLYSPLNSEKWYFIPWDFDKALGKDEEIKDSFPDWQNGLQRYWGTVIHKRYLRDPKNIEKLNAKIEELSQVINEESTKEKIDSYYPIVKSFVAKDPDLRYLSIEASEYDSNYRKLETVTSRYKKLYEESLEYPMPIFLHHERKGNRDMFKWEASHDLQAEKLTYHFQVDTDPSFQSPIISIKDAKKFMYETDTLSPGRYYWRVLIKDEKGHTQIPFDYYRDPSKVIHWGLQEIIVPKGATK